MFNIYLHLVKVLYPGFSFCNTWICFLHLALYYCIREVQFNVTDFLPVDLDFVLGMIQVMNVLSLEFLPFASHHSTVLPCSVCWFRIFYELFEGTWPPILRFWLLKLEG